MRIAAGGLRTVFLVLLLLEAGCNPAPADLEPSAKAGNDFSTYAGYAADKIEIMPLTECVHINDIEYTSRIKVYVCVLDAFGCQIKAPAIFRFELYQHVRYSAEPKGKRIFIWPDIDLTGPARNNQHWRDFLRAYLFNLDLERQSSQSCVLQVTALCPSGKRLSAEFGLKPQ